MKFSLLLGLLLVQQALCAYVPVYVMLPLDSISSSGITDRATLTSWLSSLKNAGTDGITVDVWWGLVESSPQQYSWTHYSDLFSLIVGQGLKIQPILDFHECGGNVGDTCNIPLPSWVLSVGNSNPDIWYTDSQGHRDEEYISLFVDSLSLFNGRSPLQIYHDFAQSFANQFSSYLGNQIVQIEIGMGPAGELRYPSYQLKYWNFCGVGEFQSYSKYALQSLQAAAQQISQPQWALAGGPNNAGQYSYYINGAPFFQDNTYNNYQSSYGQFFLSWYSSSLMTHGSNVLSRMQSVFQNTGANIMGKVAGIHWWYKTNSHAAELTAGYYNTNNNNAYLNIANMFAQNGASMDFTCLEMLDSSQSSSCDCGPEELVAQVKSAASSAGIAFGGENALPFYDQGGYSRIETAAGELGYALDSFSYLRLTKDLVQPNNLNTFKSFVNTMHNLNVFSGAVYMATTADESTPSNDNNNNSLGVKVGAGIAGASVGLLVVVAAVLYVRNKRRSQLVDMSVPLKEADSQVYIRVE